MTRRRVRVLTDAFGILIPHPIMAQEKCTEIFIARTRDIAPKNAEMSALKSQVDRVEQMLLIMDARMTGERYCSF